MLQRYIKNLDIRIILVIVSLLAVAWLQIPRLADAFVVDEDFRSFYWMNKFLDPELFPNRFYGYMMINLFGKDLIIMPKSLGYGFLFYLVSLFVTPMIFSKILPFFLMPITILYLFEFGKLARDRRTGVALALGFLFINLASSSAISIANGLQRSFALTFIIALIYYLHRRKYRAAAVVIVISALVYPPAMVLAVATWGLFALKLNWPLQGKRSWSTGGIGSLLVVSFLSIVILMPVLAPRFSEILAPPETAAITSQEQVLDAPHESPKHLWDDPRYQEGGGKPLFILFPLVGRGGLVDLGEDLINLLILSLVGALIYLVLGRRTFDLPIEIWALFWATWLTFGLSWAALLLTNSFLLYMPSRYTRVGLFLFLFMLVFLNIVSFIKEAPSVLQRNPQKLIWAIVGVELAVLGLVLWYPTELAKIRGFNMKWLLALAAVTVGVLGIASIKKRQAVSSSNVPDLKQSDASRALSGAAIALILIGWQLMRRSLRKSAISVLVRRNALYTVSLKRSPKTL